MIQSMTGFGKAQVALESTSYTIDIKSLNSKNIDLNVRLPFELRSKELEIRKAIAQKLKRGKVDVFINYESTGNLGTQKINIDLVKAYMQQFAQVSPDISPDFLFDSALRMPDALSNNSEEISETNWLAFSSGLNTALDNLSLFRKDEGMVLEKDFIARINNILQLLSQIPQHEESRIKTLKDRILKSLEEIQDVDQNRLEQELIFYLEKLDITEEKLRLKNHCSYFLETLNSEESNGKKLNFICQEIGREINTLGSKSNHLEMQKLVVQMKDELEKIKEQILNVL